VAFIALSSRSFQYITELNYAATDRSTQIYASGLCRPEVINSSEFPLKLRLRKTRTADCAIYKMSKCFFDLHFRCLFIMYFRM